MGILKIYSLYCLNLRSPWKFPFLRDGAIDDALGEVELVKGPAALFAKARAQATEPRNIAWYHFASLPDGTVYLRWPELFEFLISPEGRRINCLPQASASLKSFPGYMLAPVISFALLKQGIESLHCTVLNIEGAAFGILGDCGYGKSTLAAAFLREGHRLLTDDLLTLKEVGNGFLAYPGLPQIKLFPEIAQALLEGVKGTPMNPFTSKLILPLAPNQACCDPLPLKALFVLNPANPKYQGEKVTIRKIPQRRAFFALIANTFNPWITDSQRLNRQFTLAAKLAASIPIKSLSYPLGLSKLPEVVKSILLSLSW